MGKRIPVTVPVITESEATSKRLGTFSDPAWRARLLESDLPGSGIYETDYFSPPPLKRKKGGA